MSSKSGSTDSAEIDLEQLSMKIERLEEQLTTQLEEIESLKERIPNTNLISPNFLKRAFTVYGHYVAAGFIIAIPFICLTSFFAVLIMLISQQQ
jgi:hypothetical protein